MSTLNGFPADIPAQTRDSVEEFLVEQAAVLDPKTLHNIAHRIALMANPDGPYDERDAADEQQFHIGNRRDDGLTRCWWLLDDITIETLRTALAALCSPTAARTGTTTASNPTETGGTDTDGRPTSRRRGNPGARPARPSKGHHWARCPATPPPDHHSADQQTADQPPPPPDLPPAATRGAHALAAVLNRSGRCTTVCETTGVELSRSRGTAADRTAADRCHRRRCRARARPAGRRCRRARASATLPTRRTNRPVH